MASKGVRYILRRNPQRAKEIERHRQDKLIEVSRLLGKKNLYLAEHARAREEVARREVEGKVSRLKIGEWVRVIAGMSHRFFRIRSSQGTNGSGSS